MERANLNFEAGDSVKVKEGVNDPDSNGDISGWQGRIRGRSGYKRAGRVRLCTLDCESLSRQSRMKVRGDGGDYGTKASKSHTEQGP